MVARSGNSTSMLVCADCGWPVDPRTSSEEARKHWTGALLLLLFGLAGVISYFLVMVIESRAPQRQPAAIEQPAERP
jgi:NhaP-type Na+/H+ or K+/H+ antiporter